MRKERVEFNGDVMKAYEEQMERCEYRYEINKNKRVYKWDKRRLFKLKALLSISNKIDCCIDKLNSLIDKIESLGSKK